MAKQYKITYKTYFNKYLKKVRFHGIETHPLYVQLTYARQSTYFKSSMFDLFSQDRFVEERHGKKHVPSLDFVTEKEVELLTRTIEKNKDDFSLDKFQLQYRYFGTDLCISMEEAFRASLALYLADKGAQSFGRALTEGSSRYILFNILQDAKQVFLPEVYNELMSGLKKAPPYIEMYSFVKEKKKFPDKIFTVMEWDDNKTQSALIAYLEKHSNEEIHNLANKINSWCNSLLRSVKEI